MSLDRFEEDKYVLERIHRGFGIEGYIIDDQQHVLTYDGNLTQSKERFLVEIDQVLREGDMESGRPYLYTAEENIYIWGIRTVYDYMYLLGPVGGSLLNEFQIRAFCFCYKLGIGQIKVPRLTFDKILFLMCTSTYMLTGKMITEVEILTGKIAKNILTDEDTVEYQIYQYEEEKSRTEYEMERQWLERIEYGKVVRKDEELAAIGVGTMARDSDFKQYEYMAVSGIALATRAAIRGGAPPAICYETSDLLLQRASKSRNINELLEIASQIPIVFSNLVSEHIKKKAGGFLIEQCKSYIAKQLYHPFTIQQMADDLSVNRSHLSKKFKKQTGKTIQAYIIEERLSAAANLLKFSDKSVTQIAEYMQFQNLGRFSQYFKTKYGLSPKQYREQYKSADFTEKKKINEN